MRQLFLVILSGFGLFSALNKAAQLEVKQRPRLSEKYQNNYAGSFSPLTCIPTPILGYGWKGCFAAGITGATGATLATIGNVLSYVATGACWGATAPCGICGLAGAAFFCTYCAELAKEEFERRE